MEVQNGVLPILEMHSTGFINITFISYLHITWLMEYTKWLLKRHGFIQDFLLWEGGNIFVPYKCAAMKGGMNTCPTELGPKADIVGFSPILRQSNIKI